MSVLRKLKGFFRTEIVLEIDEIEAETLVMSALFRATPTANSRDWDLKAVTRLQNALTLAQKNQSDRQITAGVLPLALTEVEWKAVGRLCLTLGEKPENKWARNIANRIIADAMRRGKI